MRKHVISLSVAAALACSTVSPVTAQAEPAFGSSQGGSSAYGASLPAFNPATFDLRRFQTLLTPAMGALFFILLGGLAIWGASSGSSAKTGGVTPTPTPSKDPAPSTDPAAPSGTTSPSSSAEPTSSAAPSTSAQPTDSMVHAGMGWKPTQYDTCSKEFHDTFVVTGPDGKKYETWHPTTAVDPTTGKECTFGHDHGDDPKTSDIYDWVVEKLGEKATGIPFGYASEQSTYLTDTEGNPIKRHEDHPGHFVVVKNDLHLINKDRSKGYVKDASGNPITCDVLIKMHQGSHSSDATKNNAHELLYAFRCSDGNEAVVNTLTKLGNPNEFTKNCSEDTVATTGSHLPASTEGRRRIPDAECLSANDDVWSTYETWETVTDIKKDDGTSLVRFDPWFGVRNPSRYFDNSTTDLTNGGRPMVEFLKTKAQQEGGLSWPWMLVTDGMDKYDPASPFDGAQRDYYLAESRVNNAGGPTTWYTDAYGEHASTTPFEGSVAQYVSSTSNADLPALERQGFGFSTDYGEDGSGVHSPN